MFIVDHSRQDRFNGINHQLGFMAWYIMTDFGRDDVAAARELFKYFGVFPALGQQNTVAKEEKLRKCFL